MPSVTYSPYSNYGPDWAQKIIEQLDGSLFKIGIQTDRKKRGTAVNVDVCAYDNKAQTALLQVRTTYFSHNRYSYVRKCYYLITLDAAGNAVAYPISARSNMGIWSVLAKFLKVTPRRAEIMARQHPVSELLQAAQFRSALEGATQ
jgi:hypothetical protein